MWFSFWKNGDRLSIEEFRYLVEQLHIIQAVNEYNKDFVIEALRSFSEMVIYGDQNDPTFFEFFMEKNAMAEFLRLLKASRTVSVAIQLLQTLSIMIQNLRSEYAIYYIFSNEHINSFITHPFDFHNDELISYYISFLRAISGKLDENTISLFVKTQKDEVVSFPLYTEAIRFAFHEENMIRTAVCALTLNVYHVRDDCVHRYITNPIQAGYFSDFVAYFRNRCIKLDEWISKSSKHPFSADATSNILSAVDRVEDNLYYFRDVISSGVPNLDGLISDYILQLLVFPLLLPSVKMEFASEQVISATTSLFLLSCIVRIVKTKTLSRGISSMLFYPPEPFIKSLGTECDRHGASGNSKLNHLLDDRQNRQCVNLALQTLSSSAFIGSMERFFLCHPCAGRNLALRTNGAHVTHYGRFNFGFVLQVIDKGVEFQLSRTNGAHVTHYGRFNFGSVLQILLSYTLNEDEVHTVSSLNILATLLQTKEFSESLLDVLGILPQRSQRKSLLLKALGSDALSLDQLFLSGNSSIKDDIFVQLHMHLKKVKNKYCLLCSNGDSSISSQGTDELQVLDGLGDLLLTGSSIPTETMWHAGRFLLKLLPSVQEHCSERKKLPEESFDACSKKILLDVIDCFCDLLRISIIELWKNCRKAIESSSPEKNLKCIGIDHRHPCSPEVSDRSSVAADDRMCEIVKVFVLHHQLRIFSGGGILPDHSRVYSAIEDTAISLSLE